MKVVNENRRERERGGENGRMNERWMEQREFRLRVITSDPAKDVRRGNY